MKIIDLLKNSVSCQPNRLACITGKTTQLSYDGLLANIENLAEELKTIGCKKGVKIAIVLNNSIEYIIAMFAVWASESILVPLHGSMTEVEIERVLCESNTGVVITDMKNETKLDKLCGKKGFLSVLLTVHYGLESGIQIDKINKISPVCVDKHNQDIALMVSTSGSTGDPKIVMYDELSLLSNIQSFKQAMQFDGYYQVLLSVKIHHIYCISAQILTHLGRNDTLVIDDTSFFADDFLKKVENYKISITAFIPVMLMLLANHPNPEKYDTWSLKRILCAGANTPMSCLVKMKEKYPHVKCINAYGLTEAGPRISLTSPLNQDNLFRTAGKRIPGVEVKIVDKYGDEQSICQEGEICVKSPGIMKGYYKRPELTEQTIMDGWLRTGDIGRIDKDENLIISGRLKELINSGGDNIYPAEIEECVAEHPDVEKIAVVGKPDKIFNEIPCAFVVCKKGRTPSSLEIIKWCKDRLSTYKIPREVIFIEEMPLLSTSKYNKRQLKQILSDRSDSKRI